MDVNIKDFEGAIAELESIVRRLEEGDLALEQSLELYERVLTAAGLADQGHVRDFLQIRLRDGSKCSDIVDQQDPQRELNFDAA